MVALSETAASLGGHYHTHTRASLLSQGYLAPWHEAVDIGRRSGIPVHLTHYRQSVSGVGSHIGHLELVENARAEGIDCTFDCYTYPYSGTTPTIGLPHWAKDGGPERLIAALQDADDRERMKREITPSRLENNWLTNFTRPENMQYDGRLITDIAEMRGQDPADTLFDLLLSENLGISTVGLGTNAQTLYAFVSHPYGMIASDAILFGEYPNPRTYGCFPIVLAEFVRAEQHLRLPEAIRKMTSFPAQRLGIPDRGLLRDGFKADIVVFNPDTVKALATKENPSSTRSASSTSSSTARSSSSRAKTPAPSPAADSAGAAPKLNLNRHSGTFTRHSGAFTRHSGESRNPESPIYAGHGCRLDSLLDAPIHLPRLPLLPPLRRAFETRSSRRPAQAQLRILRLRPLPQSRRRRSGGPP